jgi:hypothetical protein
MGLMEQYSRDLQLEASTEMDRQASSFIGANSCRIAVTLAPHILAKQTSVVSQANLERLVAEQRSAIVKVNVPLRKHHQLELEDESGLEGNENSGAIVLQTTKRFLLETDAFQKLCEDLRVFSASTEETDLHVLAPSLPLRKVSTSDIRTEDGPSMEPEAFPAIHRLEAVESSNLQPLDAEERVLRGLLNMFQVWLEDTFRTELGW